MFGRIMFRSTLLILLIAALGCSTIRLNYQSKFEAADGRKGQYHMVKSYEIGGPYSTLCPLTAIFIGGACWFYLVMPTVNQTQEIEADAETKLNQTLGAGKYKIVSSSVERESWRQDEEISQVLFAPKDAP
jgi:hypothetical protein